MAAVQTRRAAHTPLTRHASWLAGTGGLLVGLFAPVIHLAGLLAGLAMVTALTCAALMSAHFRPLELWVDYDDRPTLLFVSTDRWAFNAVDRHLRRTLLELRMAYLGPIGVPGRGRYPQVDRQSGRTDPSPDLLDGQARSSSTGAARARHEYLLGKVAPTMINVPHPSTMHPSTMRPDGGIGRQRAA
jgi:hypothetical protein